MTKRFKDYNQDMKELNEELDKLISNKRYMKNIIERLNEKNSFNLHFINYNGVAKEIYSKKDLAITFREIFKKIEIIKKHSLNFNSIGMLNEVEGAMLKVSNINEIIKESNNKLKNKTDTTYNNNAVEIIEKILKNIEDLFEYIKLEKFINEILLEWIIHFNNNIEDYREISENFDEKLENYQKEQAEAISKEFRERAGEYEKSKEDWLRYSGFIAVVIFAILFWNFDGIKSLEDVAINFIKLFIPILILWFTTKQYVNSKNMQEAYTFRAKVLTVSDNLKNLNTDKEFKEYILKKWVDIWFSEPTLNKNGDSVNQETLTKMANSITDMAKIISKDK